MNSDQNIHLGRLILNKDVRFHVSCVLCTYAMLHEMERKRYYTESCLAFKKLFYNHLLTLRYTSDKYYSSQLQND